MTPEGEEALFEFGVVILGEVAEELAERFPLLFCEVRVVVELMDIADVGKDLLCRDHVFVEIIEVG